MSRYRIIVHSIQTIYTLGLGLAHIMPPTPKNYTPKTIKNKCGKCNKVVNENGLLCEYCVLWYHKQCEDISDQRYEAMCNSGNQTHWFCSICNGKAIEVLILVHSMKTEQDKIRKEVEDLRAVVTDISEVRGAFEEKIRDVVKDEINEAREKEQRCLNVMFKGVVELQDDPQAGNCDRVRERLGVVQLTSDLEVAEHLIRNVLEVEDVVATKAERLGEKLLANKYRRHVRVTLESKNMKFKLLNRARSLKDKEGCEDIYISPDLTKKQQAQDKTLRDDLKQRRDGGERNLAIKNGVIVQLPAQISGTAGHTQGTANQPQQERALRGAEGGS